MDPQVGQLINNKYRLVRLIGDGGMGSVWEARHELLGTSVALKFLHATLARRKGLVERFLQEARVSARIKSPNVVHVSDVDRTPEGLAYMVMEYIEGETLQTLYERNYQQGKRMSYGEAFTYFLQMLDGVAAAHRLGIVHRDLKPDNVMLTTDSKNRPLVKLLDFGIAKLKASGEVDRGLTRPGVVMGTPEYMAPEQAFSADRVDGRADIFSLGVMFFEMLAGRRPVGGDNAHAIAAQYLEGSIAQLRELAPNLDAQLGVAVHKAMAAKPEDRFQAVEEFRDAVEPFAPEGPRSRKRSGVPRTASPAVDALESTSPTSEDDVDTRAVDGKALEDARTEDVPAAILQAPGAPSSPRVHAGGTQNDAAAETQNDAVRGGTEAMVAVAENQSGTAQMEAAQNKRHSSGTVVGEPFETNVPYGHSVSAQYVAGAPAITPATGHRRGRSGPSLLSILLIASVVSGAVVGGLYLAHRHSLQSEADDPPPKPVPTQVAPEPQTVTEPPTPDPIPPVVEPQPQPPTVQPPPPTKPQPLPKPQPSAQPNPEPSGPPPIIPTVLPSEFPPIPPIFPLPGQIQPPPPGTQPQPQPQPTPKAPPKIIFRPRPTNTKATPPATQEQPPATERPKVIFRPLPGLKSNVDRSGDRRRSARARTSDERRQPR